MKHIHLFTIAGLAIIASAQSAQALIVDYEYVQSHNFSQETYDKIGKQTWLFTHASVGGNMIGGMNTLHSTTPNTYQLSTQSIPYDRNKIPPDPPPSPPALLTEGKVYEINRGNPGSELKYDFFEATLESGWGNSVDFVMDKLCYIDQGANVINYLQMMEDLDSRYSATFVYTTMPLTNSTDSNNVLRNNYNNAVRAYALDHDKLLYDIADLEAHDASGREITFMNASGIEMQMLSSDWTVDGGHLDPVGRLMMAKAWYAVAASQESGNDPVPEPATMFLMGTGLVGLIAARKRKKC
ncbi:MAG: PEP-CTERM sorting domain-containing protein [Proteobacteria bacterium]|nr:PEP-CTERM sorting domain-containing protein [Pseudomonadota bacterium]